MSLSRANGMVNLSILIGLGLSAKRGTHQRRIPMDGRITWAFGIEPAGLIEKRYDEEMLEKIVIDIDSNE